MNLWMLLAQTADPSSLSGSSGWAGAGLLGLVLVWLLMVHLPQKDKQIKEILEGHSKERADEREALREIHKEGSDARASERDKDRQARHEQGNAFMAGIGENARHYQKVIADIQKDLRSMAESDRQLIQERHTQLVAALERQTVELRDAILGGCNYPNREIHA